MKITIQGKKEQNADVELPKFPFVIKTFNGNFYIIAKHECESMKLVDMISLESGVCFSDEGDSRTFESVLERIKTGKWKLVDCELIIKE